jgi:BirA family transcriptional regulator, biotin operon repressor / biotin---[acetyl-CoA-carboxylase] ligase
MPEPADSNNDVVAMVLARVLAQLGRDGRMTRETLRRWAGDAGTAPEHVEALLGRLGVSVAQDVHLTADVEPLDASVLEAALAPSAHKWVRELNLLPVTDSTNTRMMARASSDSIDGIVYCADAQTAGRGRRGRDWYSPYGRNVSLSIGLRVRRPAAELSGLSLAVGLAVADVLGSAETDGVQLKWPNDVFVHGRKAGGILIEFAHADVAASELIVGIGLNLVIDPELEAVVGQPVAALRAHGLTLGRNQLIAALIGAVYHYARRYESEGFGPMRAAYSALNIHHGATVVVTGPNAVDGVVRGVDDAGALLLETANGIQAITAGEVGLRPVARTAGRQDTT